MKTWIRPLLYVALTICCSLAMFAQAKKPGVLEPADLSKILPTSYFFDGQSAPVQARNSGAARFENGKLFIVALVDNSGYSTDVQAKYQGLLITETAVTLGDKELAPGEYGFGFTKDGKFNILNVAGDEVSSVAYQQDEAVKHPVPLKIAAADGGYRLYAGKKFVAFKAK